MCTRPCLRSALLLRSLSREERLAARSMGSGWLRARWDGSIMNKHGRTLQALGGLALDVYRRVAFAGTNPHSLSKFHALRATQGRTGATTFVETGTYLGVTTARCAPHFSRVYTIEIEPSLAEQAERALGRYRNVEVIRGDASTEIKRLGLAGCLRDSLIFLDGHFSGGLTGLGAEIEPALSIMDYLAQGELGIRGIVVDDFREFGSDGWPRKWELVKAAEELFVPQGYRLSIDFDMLFLERRLPAN
jgi:hypothetical protein